VGTPARFTVEDDAGTRRVLVRGDLDLAAVSGCREALLEAVEAGTRVVLDLRGVGHLASAGIGLVLEALQRARGRGAAADLRALPGSPAARVLALSMPDGT
jgi:anti-anti-sigma factor